ncbi:MAG: hypothetical protein MZU84_00195 [Sphingobacterium sp.]|nr:hypothetical protein [Sphingobacterium sp.]
MNLLNLLNKALADEWLAYYQYWIGAKVVKGPMKDAVIAELTFMQQKNLSHAELLVNKNCTAWRNPCSLTRKNGLNLPTAVMMSRSIHMLK